MFTYYSNQEINFAEDENHPEFEFNIVKTFVNGALVDNLNMFGKAGFSSIINLSIPYYYIYSNKDS